MGGFDYKVIIDNLPFLGSGLLLSLKLFAIALVGGIFFGTLLAMARLSSWRVLSYSSAGFVNLIRSVPFIMAIFWFYFLTPMLVGKLTGQQGEAVGPFTSYSLLDVEPYAVRGVVQTTTRHTLEMQTLKDRRQWVVFTRLDAMPSGS